MTDGQWLFTVFAALYLLECVRWLPGTAVVLTGAGSFWQTRRPVAPIQLAQLKPLLLPILPPQPLHLITLPWPLAPCDTGLEVCGTDDSRSAIIAWDELSPEVEGPQLHLCPTHRLRLPDEKLAAEWQQRLVAWKGMNDTARAQDFLKFARRTLDSEALTKTAARLSEQSRALRWLAASIFVWTFGVITGIYRWFGEGPEVLAAAAGLFVLLWAQAVVFWRAAKRGQPGLRHRFWKTLAIAFLPQHAMRAADLLCRAEVTNAHPLASHGLLEEAAWRRLAVDFWKAARYGFDRSAPLQLQALETCFRHHGLDPAELEAAPVRESGSEAYCPRCLAQFRTAAAVCQDCGGITLRQWPESAG